MFKVPAGASGVARPCTVLENGEGKSHWVPILEISFSPDLHYHYSGETEMHPVHWDFAMSKGQYGHWLVMTNINW